VAALRATVRARVSELEGVFDTLEQRFGRVINLASVVGPRANAGQAN
jgi:hypothetical protein